MCHRCIPGTSWQQAHRVPVVCYSLQSDSFTDVDQVEDILLEAGPAKAHAGIQELGADARVRANGMRDLAHANGEFLE